MKKPFPSTHKTESQRNQVVTAQDYPTKKLYLSLSAAFDVALLRVLRTFPLVLH